MESDQQRPDQLPAAGDMHMGSEESDDEEWPPLHFATHNGDLEEVESLLKDGADLSETDNYCRNALHLLVSFGHRSGKGTSRGTSILKAFLNHSGSDAKQLLSSIDMDDCTPLHLAVRNLDGTSDMMADMFEKLLQAYRTVFDSSTSGSLRTILDSPDCQGDTPLHYAARIGNFQAISLLLDAGASRCARNWKGQTPCHVFVEHFRPIEEKLRGITSPRRLLYDNASVDTINTGSLESEMP